MNKQTDLVIALGIVAVLVIGLLGWQANQSLHRVVASRQSLVGQQATFADKEPSATPLVYDDERIPDDMVLFYTRQIADEGKFHERSYPILELWWKVGRQPAELLTTVGKFGEYPADFTLIDNHQKVIVNLEQKLQLLDVATKELRDIFTAQHRVASYRLNADDTQLLILDYDPYANRDVNSDKSYDIYRLSLVGGEKTNIAHGTNLAEESGCGGYPFLVEEKDYVIEISCGLGEVSNGPYFLDLTTSKISQGPDFGAHGGGSAVGGSVSGEKLQATITQETDDVCNDFSGLAAAVYKVTDKTTKTVLGSFGDLDHKVPYWTVISPDETAILYAQEDLYTRGEVTDSQGATTSRCFEEPKNRQYYLWRAADNTSTPVDDYLAVLTEWKKLYYVVKTDYSDNQNSSITFDDQPIITSSGRPYLLELIAAYQQAQ